MGNMSSALTNPGEKRPFSRRELFDLADSNGYVCCDNYVPDELLAFILSLVPPRELVFNCRLVCKAWCNLIDSQVWREKLHRTDLEVGDINKLLDFPWFCSYFVVKGCLNKNFLKNECGGDQFEHWKILINNGNRWVVENPPTGSDPFPVNMMDEVHSESCFVTSYYTCSKEQTVDVKEVGCPPQFMDEFKPVIVATEWVAGRFDCCAIYEMYVLLLDDTHEILNEYKREKNVGGRYGSSWTKVSLVIRNYSEGVRYIKFIHQGSDKQFWAGHYGSKMTGASLKLVINSNLDKEQES